MALAAPSRSLALFFHTLGTKGTPGSAWYLGRRQGVGLNETVIVIGPLAQEALRAQGVCRGDSIGSAERERKEVRKACVRHQQIPTVAGGWGSNP